MTDRPNLLLVLADQWRGQDQGWTEESGVLTPHLDRLAAQGVAIRHAYSSFPVCGPSRASLLTGRLPSEHGVVVNDLPLRDDSPTFADVLQGMGYQTGWVGNWHLNGMPREQWVPPSQRHGFHWWASAHCSQKHRDGHYFTGDHSPQPVHFSGYEPEVLTDIALTWIDEASRKDLPYAFVVSLAPPHDPYDTVPQRYRRRYADTDITTRANTCQDQRQADLQMLYWSAISAVDDQIGRLRAAVEQTGRAQDTIIVVTSDHGDMLGSHGLEKKQVPYDESIRIPLVFHWPDGLPAGRHPEGLFGGIDIAPTLLGLIGASGALGHTYGRDLSSGLRGADGLRNDLLLGNPVSSDNGYAQGVPNWRGYINRQETYARSDGHRPWLLFDTRSDPWQLHNLVSDPNHQRRVQDADMYLQQLLRAAGENPMTGTELITNLGLQRLWNAREAAMHGSNARLIHIAH